MNPIRTLLLPALLILSSLSSLVQADLDIVVTRGYDAKTKIAIVPFFWSGSDRLDESVDQTITNNLMRTGQFDPLDPSSMLSQPSSEQSVFYRDWRLLGQEYLVIGHMEPTEDGQIKADIFLFDVVKNQRLFKVSQVLSNYQLRDFAHSLSDLIYERITGVKGVFSTRIAFVTREISASQEYSYRLQIADADGQRARTIYKSSEPIISATWSADGKKLAFANKVGDRWKIFIQELSTGRVSSISDNRGYTSSPTFSADGRYLAYVSSDQNSPELYLYDFQTGLSRRLTRNSYIDTEPSFAPDSQHIVYTSEKGGRPQIYRYSLATGQTERLTYEGSQNMRPKYSYDGKYIVFIHVHEGRYHVASMDLATKNLRVLTETYLDESPSIAPNGTMLVYATQRNGKGILAWVSLDGQVTNQMSSTFGDVIEPAWSPYLN
ncbi:Tol-Pal system beta propeller repeat protein TolB [Reinekea thalattae]|uniref:Tol-Pal system protein TolB n=1 Tax=Reinekea thalattae TaxID=2593301 RepID=A0A5C8ZA32_9GAMM|nr:Tol-Pal system beta propeller repeat protein TolB [Reinekea thalattae]TXR54021.1 Tol-Pal system beta propeller repeat protein TolB [Reinekea thalattae]